MNAIILTEWNGGALFVIFLLYLIPITIVFFLLRGLLKIIPTAKLYLNKLKEEKRINNLLVNVLVFVFSIVLTCAILGLTYYIRGGRGLLE